MNEINLTPTWAATADMLVTVITETFNDDDLQFALDEVRRMGRIIDQYQQPACLKDSLRGLPKDVRRDLVTAIDIADIAIEASVFEYGKAPEDFGIEDFQQTALLLQRLNSFAAVMED